MPTTTSGLLSVSQAAAILNLTRRAVLHRIATGALEATKLGEGRTSAYVITADEVERAKHQDRAWRSESG